jgi:hypothetical protein
MIQEHLVAAHQLGTFMAVGKRLAAPEPEPWFRLGEAEYRMGSREFYGPSDRLQRLTAILGVPFWLAHQTAAVIADRRRCTMWEAYERLCVALEQLARK